MEIKEIKQMLLANHNIILHGAPGTGKTYLAQKIAEELGATKEYGRFKMVQFHPSYDYTDFVEGLRPEDDGKGNIVFKRKDGVFKEFCRKAVNAKTEFTPGDNGSDVVIEEMNEHMVYKKAYKMLLDKVSTEHPTFMWGNNKRELKVIDDNVLQYKSSQGFRTFNHLELLFSHFYKNNDYEIDKIHCNDINKVLANAQDIDANSADFAPHKWAIDQLLQIAKDLINRPNKQSDNAINRTQQPPFIFLIDEINRGDMSKIFGELFYAIDPGYRGEDGKIDTQYQNLVTAKYKDENGDEHDDPFYKGFYVPDNVYIIGTMNDIDRSVESMDFAMRRRFQFIEVTAEDRAYGMGLKKEENTKADYKTKDAYARMTNLNNCIISKEIGMSKAYQIGGSYFLSNEKDSEGNRVPIKDNFENLWKYKLEGLLREYLRGEEESVIDNKLNNILKPAFNCENVYRYNEKGELYKTQNIQTGGNDSSASTETDQESSESSN